MKEFEGCHMSIVIFFQITKLSSLVDDTNIIKIILIIRYCFLRIIVDVQKKITLKIKSGKKYIRVLAFIFITVESREFYVHFLA